VFGASLQRLDHDDTERTHLVVMLLDGDIFSPSKDMVAEAIAGFVIVRIAKEIVMKRPRASRLSDQVTDLIVLSLPETQHTATIPERFPSGMVDLAIVIERRGKLIPACPTAFGKIAIAGQFQTNLKEAH
jgi:hypothetical protein